MNTRTIKDIHLTCTEYDENILAIWIRIESRKGYYDDEDSEIGEHSYEMKIAEYDVYPGTVIWLKINDYKEAFKYDLVDIPDCGLLNYYQYGYNLENMTIKEILTEIFINTDGEEILLEEYEKD